MYVIRIYNSTLHTCRKDIEYLYTREHFLLLKRLVHLIEYFNKMSTISQENLSFFIYFQIYKK